ncbi:pyridoxamine 5'-phosphate oxidase [Schizopora paradoxa]|uniref:pyridoxal 5'-phosphate synthase n=1 Tax=Schizopora paradoxa TaxID=27342 RepID=A0A0H2RYD4_9AGAM|nr:pyridoxamine 5'-phosphate oxidase [Schizopora paradoxa]
MDAVLEQKDDKILVKSRIQYEARDDLAPFNVSPSPIEQFRAWFKEALEGGKVREPEAMALSTATPSGVPSTRFVLLKQVDARGFVFFTNYDSRKSKELSVNPHASLALYWGEIHRQVRVVGRVERVSREESEAYYNTRPLGSRIGAWASPQSKAVGDGEVLRLFDEAKERFGAKDGAEPNVPLPDHWGGWRIIPDEVEFWAGKPSRLHDRVRYMRIESTEDQWKIERLAP